MKANKKNTRRSKKTVAKKGGWFSNALSRIKNGKVMKKLRGIKDSLVDRVHSVVDWVDYNEHKITSGLILGFGVMLMCPLVEPWTAVGIIAILVGLVRLLMR